MDRSTAETSSPTAAISYLEKIRKGFNILLLVFKFKSRY